MFLLVFEDRNNKKHGREYQYLEDVCNYHVFSNNKNTIKRFLMKQSRNDTNLFPFNKNSLIRVSEEKSNRK